MWIFYSKYCILNDTLARALITIGATKNKQKKIAINTLRKRQAAVRLIVLSPDKFETIANKYKSQFLCDDMLVEIKYALISYYKTMENIEKGIEQEVKIPTLKRWLEESRDGSFWPTKTSWIAAARSAYQKLNKIQEKESSL